MEEEKTNFSETRLAQWLLALLLLALTLGVYQQVWRAGFIWQDDLRVTANPLLSAAEGWRQIWSSFARPADYFPLTNSIYRLEWMLWSVQPAGYHWVNLGLHALNALLLWRLLRLLRIPGAWLAAALFALHPVQVETVAWVAQLGRVLMTFFALAALWSWARFFKKDTRARALFYLAALVFFVAALLSAGAAVILPAIFLLALWLKRKPLALARWAQLAPFFLLAAASVWWRSSAQLLEFFTANPGAHLLQASWAFCLSLAKLAWPLPLVFDYPAGPAVPLAYLWPALILLAVLVAWISVRSAGRSVAAALLFFGVALLPALGVPPADHAQYLAAIGPLALLAAGIALFAARKAAWLQPAVAVLLLGSLGAVTWRHSADFRDAETLWRTTLARNPQSALAHAQLGLLLDQRGAVEEAVAEYRAALASQPEDAEANNHLGYALARMGQPYAALPYYEKSLAANPESASAQRNLTALLLQMGREDEALAHLLKLAQLEPWDAGLEQLLGDIYARRRDVPAAMEHWKRALELDPQNAELQATVGQTLGVMGQMQEALTYLRRATELAPEKAQPHYNLATALSLMERCAEAIPEYQAALRIQRDFPAAQMNLALCYLRSERLEEAAAEYERLLQTRPDDLTAHKNLAIILPELGRAAEADAHAKRAAELEATPAP